MLLTYKKVWGGDKMAEKSALDWTAFVLVVVGGLNWGLVGLFGLDLVALIFGSVPLLQQVVYILVGLSALYMVYYAATKKK